MKRLVRCYPRAWRVRYGDEFEEMLLAELEENPASWRRSVDVAAHGLLSRLHLAGLAGDPLESRDQARASLAAFGCAAGVFLVFGVAAWAQLTVGWEWSEPDTVGTVAGMVLMSGTALVLGLFGVAASVPVVAAAGRRVVRGGGRVLLWPTIFMIVGGGVLVAGAHHFGNGWPGTHGHAWSDQGLVPGGVAAFLWASTLWVSAYWAHPAALADFPTLEIVWMVVSPMAIVLFVTGAAKTVRRIELSPAVLRFELRMAEAALAVMVLFSAGVALWVLRGGPGPRNLFHTGAIDSAALVIMAVSLVGAYRAMSRARLGRLLAT